MISGREMYSFAATNHRPVNPPFASIHRVRVQKRLGNHHDWRLWMIVIYHLIYPLVNIQKAIENGHRNSGFSH